MSQYNPPCTVTVEILSQVATIAEAVGRMQSADGIALKLRRVNRIRSIHGSLAIEGNTLTETQMTAILDGQRVVAPPREIQEVRNAIKVYDQIAKWKPDKEDDLLSTHGLLMSGLIDSAGHYRSGSVGVMGGNEVIHIAPPASRVPVLMQDLFGWLQQTDLHPLVASSIFHYEFEFIHPFEDGNGRMGRFWQTLLLRHWNGLFEDLPIESMVYERQSEYYKALNESTQKSDSAPFIGYMLEVILSTIESLSTPQDSPQVTPQVEKLLNVLKGEMSRSELMEALELSDRNSFRERYLSPALNANLIEMTLPEKPNSRLQKYRLVKL